MKKIFAGVIAVLLCTAAYGQNAGTVTNHAFPIGKGPGVQGYTSLLCGSAQLAVGQAAADPICRTITGDWTLSAAGVATLATVNGNVGTFGSATACITTTVNAKGLTTAISAATCTPAVGSITGLGTGVGAALALNVGSAGAPVTFGGTLAANQVTRANEAQGIARSVIGVTGNVTANVTDIQGTANQALVVNSGGTALSFGQVNLAAAAAVTGILPIANGGTSFSTAPFRSESSPANPTGTASGAQVMAGLAGSFTPATSGKMQLMVQSTFANSTINDGCIVQMRFGTGGAPVNGAAATGTAVGKQQSGISFAANAQVASTLIAYVTGLTPTTVYWFDLGQAAVTGGTCSVTAIVMDAFEQ